MDEVKLDALSGRAGVIVADQDAGGLERISHQVLDDVLYNVIFDLVLEVHREEKVRRANTAAIRVEKLAADAADASDPDSKPDVRTETDAAIYEDGKVLLKGNPLQTTKDILCPRCHLPRLLHPTEGRGAQKPDPGVIYCKKHPYIDKPGYDIYGQTWVAPGPGRGKKKKDMERKLDPSVDGTVTPTPDGQRPPNVLSFPSATCSKCKRCILVTRLNNHMGACIGNSGRNASRVASQKITNGSSVGGDATPPSSQKGTPFNGSRAGSPRKRDRDADDLDDDQDSDATNPKKKSKKLKAPTKIMIKNKPKKDKERGVKASSFLSVESRLDDEDDEEDKRSTVQVAPKKHMSKQPSPAKKLKLGTSKPPLGSPKPKNGSQADGYESSDTLSDPPHAS
ncbi:hypothetical protein VP1G_03348 [Cytospora mali]|uniref:Transcriptional activator n=1 Tax=Cytospora mali TaxID=578113 RepID=A0A194UWH9_CYTMA|nr:hypothetical protein VP1G_03348 [Valsa mali var. pyri (nom. inval.)]